MSGTWSGFLDVILLEVEGQGLEDAAFLRGYLGVRLKQAEREDDGEDAHDGSGRDKEGFETPGDGGGYDGTDEDVVLFVIGGKDFRVAVEEV